MGQTHVLTPRAGIIILTKCRNNKSQLLHADEPRDAPCDRSKLLTVEQHLQWLTCGAAEKEDNCKKIIVLGKVPEGSAIIVQVPELR